MLCQEGEVRGEEGHLTEAEVVNQLENDDVVVASHGQRLQQVAGNVLDAGIQRCIVCVETLEKHTTPYNELAHFW